MRLDDALIRKLDLSACADAVTGGHLDRLPPLLLDRCLVDAKSTLIASTVAAFTAGMSIPSETLTMPRKGFGPRPVTIISPGTRLIYSALIDQLGPGLPSPSRDPDNWKRYEDLADPDSEREQYLVEFDIASCYEYIDHALLFDELVLRTMDAPCAGAVVSLLNEVFPRHRGLPQLILASDSLADAYLEVMERELLRGNPRICRYADDFRILCDDWGAANETIEEAAESARTIGLILASDKTSIWKSRTLRERRRSTAAFIVQYFQDARDALTTIRSLWRGYEEPEDIEMVEPDDEALVREALRRIFEDWFSAQDSTLPDNDSSSHLQYLPAALGVLGKGAERLPDEWLAELVFRHPLRLQQVALYLRARAETAENWKTLSTLTAMQRQSPWSKVWLLNAANSQLPGGQGGERAAEVLAWVAAQLTDKHEIVRSEAAWHLANQGAISESQLAAAYRLASPLTRPAIAAACGAVRLPSRSGLVRAVKQDGQLTGAAYGWGSPG